MKHIRNLFVTIIMLMLAPAPRAQTSISGGGGSGLSTYTVANLPSSPAANAVAIVSDGNGVSCTSGGGSTRVLCQYNGSSWVVISASGGFTNPMTTLGDMIYENVTPAPALLAGPTTPNGVPQILTDTPSGGLAATEAWALPGVPTNAQTGTTYTILVTDRASYLTFSNAGSIAVTLPSASSAGFGSNFVVVACDIGAGTATITPTTSTISYTTGSAYTSAASSIALTTGQCAWIYSDNTNYFAIQRTGGAPVYPVTVSGTVTSGGIPYFNSTTQSSSSAILNTGFLIKGGGAGNPPTNTLCDEGATTANTLTCTNTSGLKVVSVQTGTSPPACTPGTAGAWCATEGTAFTNAAGTAGVYPDSTTHEFMGTTNGASTATPGLMVRVQPGKVHQTAQTAAITTATLCAAAAGACNVAGNYTVEWAFTQVGTACGTPGTGGVTFLLTWTDQNATVHSAIGLAMDDSASLVATTGTFHFTTSNATAWASGQFNISSNGSIIQYATGYTACSVGTGSYQLDAWVTRKE